MFSKVIAIFVLRLLCLRFSVVRHEEEPHLYLKVRTWENETKEDRAVRRENPFFIHQIFLLTFFTHLERDGKWYSHEYFLMA